MSITRDRPRNCADLAAGLRVVDIQVALDGAHALHEVVDLFGKAGVAVCQRALEVLRVINVAEDRPVIAVNIPARSLGSDRFIATLRALLAKYHDCSRDLMFEITETARVQDLVRAGNVIQALRDKGHRVCLDDFGAGFRRFPLPARPQHRFREDPTAHTSGRPCLTSYVDRPVRLRERILAQGRHHNLRASNVLRELRQRTRPDNRNGTERSPRWPFG